MPEKNAEKLISDYIKIRDAIKIKEAEHKKELARFKAVQDRIEAMLMAEFNDTGAESVRTQSGTAYRSIQTSVKVADRVSFFDFVFGLPREEGECFLEAKANKSAVEQYMEIHDGELPAGVNVTRIATINIRRS